MEVPQTCPKCGDNNFIQCYTTTEYRVLRINPSMMFYRDEVQPADARNRSKKVLVPWACANCGYLLSPDERTALDELYYQYPSVLRRLHEE
jgi:predicted RNA-binding Zn-ribbon protein involved in translation (DUF1610 family)